VGVDFVQKPSSVALIKDSSESPWLLLQWLHVLNLDEEHIAGLSTLNVKRTGQVMDPCQVDVLHVVGTIIVANLSTSPIDALNLDNFSLLDRACGWDYEVMSGVYVLRGVVCLLSGCQRFCQ